MLGAQLAWGWQPALYLFFGGLGAGMFIVAAFLFYRFKETFRRAISIAAWAATLCLGVGLLLLVLELTQPLRGLMLWQSFSHFDSWMAIGAWIVFAAVVVFAVAAILSTQALTKRIALLENIRKPFCNVLFGLGAVLGLAVAIYTGILLFSAPGIPFWHTWLLPCLFTVSALDTGIAGVEIILLLQSKKKTQAADSAQTATVKDTDTNSSDSKNSDSETHATKTPIHKVNVVLEISVVVLVILELIILAVYLQSMLAGGNFATTTATYAAELATFTSASSLIAGKLALLFWILVVVVGLAMPLLGALSGLILKDKFGGATVLFGAVCALVGGCTLRFLILYAGVHADYFADAAYWLVH